MKYKKIAAFAAIPALALGMLGLSQSASAQGLFGGVFTKATPEEIATHQTNMFQHQAELLGLSVDEVKQAWAEGKGMKELIEEKGIDPETIKTKMKAEAEARMKEHLQTLVDKGVITQAQADQRLETMKNKQGEMKTRFGRGGGPGGDGFFEQKR